jgi:hypothetical protein
VSDTSKSISVTLKAGGGYDMPWIVLYADTPDEMNNLIKGVNDAGLPLTVRLAAQGFQTAVQGTPEQAVQAVLGGSPAPAMHGAPVTPGPGATPGTGVGNYPPAPPMGDQELPPGLNPACPTCGGPTKLLVDQKHNPPQWRGYFCQNAPRGGPKHDVTWVK